MSGTAKPPLPIERPRFPAGTAVGGRKVGGQFMSDSIVSAAREGMVSKSQLDTAQKTIEQQQQQINQSQKELQDQQQQIDQIQRAVQEQPSRMQRLAGAASRTIAPLRALGPMGILRNINRAASTDRSMVNFDLMDARRVADATGFGAFGGVRGGVAGPGAERVLFNISRDMSAVRGSLSRIETTVNKIAGDSPVLGGAAPRATAQEAGGGGIAGLIGSMLGGLGNMFGGGGGGGLGGAIRRLISTVARAIFTKIPIIGPLILVALNIEGAMEEYERNGLGAAITDLISGIGSDLTFGIVSKDSIKEFINNGIQRVTEWWNTAKETLQGVVDSVIDNVKGFYDNVRTRFAETRDALATRFEEAKNTLVETFNNVRDTVEGAISSVLSGIRNFFSSMVNGYRDARNRLREASAEAEANRQRALEEMSPTRSGNPGQAGARGIAASYNIRTEDYGAVQDMLMNAPEGETPEQRAERERLSEVQRRLERSSRDGNVSIDPQVSEYIARRLEAGEQLPSMRAQQGSAPAGGSANATPGQDAPERIRPENGTFNQGGLSVQHQATTDGRFFISGSEVDESTYRRFRELIRSNTMNMDESQLAARNESLFNLLTEVQSGRATPQNSNPAPAPAPAAPPPDTRSQAMTAGANHTPTVIVNNVGSGGGQAAASNPAPRDSGGLIARLRRSRQPTHPARPNDVGSAAMNGNAIAY